VAIVKGSARKTFAVVVVMVMIQVVQMCPKVRWDQLFVGYGLSVRETQRTEGV